ncbi:ABC-type transport auxiliary lipoprotein family protein [Maricaulis maris]|uniref:ABC-type transport auxiliary lipoprotein family protein n=1 Tax=Maricaulis maris TaxID=74318 RepID=UPI003A9386F5
MELIRKVIVFLALSFLSGCGALTAISDASAPLDDYTLSPAVSASAARSGDAHLVVELPVSAGVLATDRILIKPVPFQAQYLPGARWSEPAPALVQSLLVASFQNLGGFGLVGRTGAGLMPDYTLMTDLQAFQAEPGGLDTEPFVVRISAMLTLIRESDRRIVASRRFIVTSPVQTDDTLALVRGFENAMQSVLLEAVLWTTAQTR